MALVVKDRVKETSTSTGTGNFTLAGAVDGFQAFSAALANGDTTYYAITDAGTGDFEVGLGTYNAGVVTRTAILESTNAGAAVNFGAGEKEVFITYPAEKAVYADASGNISVPGLVDGRDLAADGSKLDGIEAGATADQTGAEIKSLYEAQANTNAYTDAEKSKLAGIEAGATADQTAAEIKTAYESNANTNAFTDAEQSKLAGIEAGADVTDTVNVTAAGALMDSEVTNLAALKAFDPTDYATASQGALADSALQSSDIGVSVQGYNANTVIDAAYVHTDNNYTTAEKSKLAGIEAGATADQTAAEILTAIKTVDGAASGLDADLLDGQEGSYYTGYTDTAAAAKVSKTGDTMTGALDVQSTITADGLTVDGDVTINGGDILIQNTAGTNYLRFYEDLETLFDINNLMPYDPFNALNSSVNLGTAGLVHYAELDTGDGEPTTTNDTVGFASHYKINASVADTTTDQVHGRFTILEQDDASESVNAVFGSRNFVRLNLGKSNNVMGLQSNVAVSGVVNSQTTSNGYLRGAYSVASFTTDSTSSNNTMSASGIFGAQIAAVAYGDGNNNIVNVNLHTAVRANLSAYLYQSSGSTLNITESTAFYASIYNRDYVAGASTLNITNQYGLKVANDREIAGSVGTMYGVHVGDFSNSATTFYNFYGAAGDAYFGGNLETTGNITVGGTVDGRDIAADGTKLDGIEAGATADQTKADIDALGIDAATLGGNNAAYFTGYTDTAVAALVDAAPGTLDTLNELAAALGDDPNFATTVTNNIATKVAKSGDTMTGNLSSTAFIGTSQSTTAPSAEDAKFDGFGVQGNRASNPIYIHNQSSGGVRISSNAGLGTANGVLVTDAGINVTGNIVVSGTVDGRDVAADGAKLDGIEAGATADQTITAGAGLTGGGTGDVTISHADTSAQASVNNSAGTVIQDVTLDTYGHVTGLVSYNLDGRYYTESEADSRFVNVTGDTMSGDLSFGSTTRQMINLYSTSYGIGIQSATAYVRTGTRFSVHAGGVHSNTQNDPGTGGTNIFTVTAGEIKYNGSNNIFHDGYHPNADKLTTARNIALTGAVTGNANFDGSGNISIATTATSDPTLTINGDASGSATFTNLGNATLTLTIADDSHNHVISNVDGLQAALDGKLSTSGKAADSNLLDGIDSSSFLRSDVSDTVSPGRQTSFYSYDVLETSSGDQASLEVFQDTPGADAFMQFHVSGDYAAYFGLKGDINDFAVGGWSMGNTYYRVWHAGNDGAGSGLDADLLDGQQGSYYYSPANPPPAGGAVGGGSDEIFWENDQVVTTNYTITNGKNAGSFGPITINSGVTVTVGAGEVWTVI